MPENLQWQRRKPDSCGIPGGFLPNFTQTYIRKSRENPIMKKLIIVFAKAVAEVDII